MRKLYLSLTDPALTTEINRKKDALIREPEYALALKKGVDCSLRYISDLASWWTQNPEARAELEEELKTHDPRDVKMLSREHAERIGKAWAYLRGAVDYSKKSTQRLVNPGLLLQIAEMIDSKNSRYRRFNEKAESFEPEYKPPHAAQVEPLVQELCKNLNSANIHPVDVAAYAHMGIVAIQPYLAAHKRLGRLLQDSILLDAHLPTATIFPGERRTYYELLRNALTGGMRERVDMQVPFFNYVAGKVNVRLDNCIAHLFTERGREIPEPEAKYAHGAKRTGNDRHNHHGVRSHMAGR